MPDIPSFEEFVIKAADTLKEIDKPQKEPTLESLLLDLKRRGEELGLAVHCTFSTLPKLAE